MTAFIYAGRKYLIHLGKSLESLNLFRFAKARQATFYDALMQHDGFFSAFIPHCNPTARP